MAFKVELNFKFNCENRGSTEIFLAILEEENHFASFETTFRILDLG